MGRLTDKVALITVDEQGLAAAVARAFGREGATVVVADADEARLASIAREVAATGVDCMALVMDPTSPESCEQGVAKLVARYGRLDILCNLAGDFPRIGPLHEVDEDTWDHATARNIKSVLLVSRYAIPAKRESGTGGSIVNLSHTAALNGVPGTSVLAATKGALINMTRDMAIQGRREGFRVNCVCVGSTFVPVIPSLIAEHTQHLTTPDDVAPLFVYLASDESRHTYGSILTIDDGMHAWR
jgi:NAD(P)-dependent dehydrogenase (short-subunit alcohol dehydrogenase family)